MKKLLILLPMILLLAGCGSQETFETVTDPQPVMMVLPDAQQIMVEYPEDAGAPVLQSENAGKIFFCDGYQLTIHTAPGGDLNATLKNHTGYEKAQLPVMETKIGDLKRYECVWTAAGETQEQVGRLCILDDGNYHYVMTVMADAANAGRLQETWQNLFDSMRLLPADLNLDTAS